MKEHHRSIINICTFCIFIFSPYQIHAEPSIRMQIDSALMGLQPLDTIRSISRRPISKIKLEGVSVETNNGNGYEEVIHINFDPALRFHGVSTQEITLSFEPPYSDFYALVYGVFDGDINSFVKELDLNIGTPGNTPAVGKYNRPLSDTKGCPITLGASPIDNDHFVFGPGWCNGD
jgi:hypothetical protein